MARPKIFIGSSSARLEIATALHSRLEHEFLVTVWDQGAFRPSDYPIPSLLSRCAETDFAIQILAPDVIQKDSDGRDVFAPNANVLIEAGLFMGALGQRRVFLVAPTTFSKIKMPSDFHGLTIVPYDADRGDNNWDAAVATAANKIRSEITLQWPEVQKQRLPWHKVKMFQDLDAEFQALVRETGELQSCYIHSRRWRENYGDALRQRMQSGHLKTVRMFLPDVGNGSFIRDLAGRFDDAPAIPAMILDAFRWTNTLGKEFGARVELFLFAKIPAYSFYIFDSAAIVAMYNLAIIRKPVPAIEAKKGDEVWSFLMRDVPDFQRECRQIGVTEIETATAGFRTEFQLTDL